MPLPIPQGFPEEFLAFFGQRVAQLVNPTLSQSQLQTVLNVALSEVRSGYANSLPQQPGQGQQQLQGQGGSLGQGLAPRLQQVSQQQQQQQQQQAQQQGPPPQQLYRPKQASPPQPESRNWELNYVHECRCVGWGGARAGGRMGVDTQVMQKVS